MIKPKTDMTGWIMTEHGVPNSKLTVIAQAEDHIRKDGRHELQWLCECNCEEHNQTIVKDYNLKKGLTLSCGCLHKKQLIERNKQGHKTNVYNLSGEYGIGWTSNTNVEFYFDIEDYDKIKDYCWYEGHSGKTSTLLTHVDTDSIISMHQLLGFQKHDHINQNELDNRKSNLRQCTHAENCRNRSKRIDNTSGIVGVSFDKNVGKWRPYIMINGTNTFLGCFSNKEDAIKIRLNAEVKYYGEFAPQKHLFEQYGITTQSDCEVAI